MLQHVLMVETGVCDIKLLIASTTKFVPCLPRAVESVGLRQPCPAQPPVAFNNFTLQQLDIKVVANVNLTPPHGGCLVRSRNQSQARRLDRDGKLKGRQARHGIAALHNTTNKYRLTSSKLPFSRHVPMRYLLTPGFAPASGCSCCSTFKQSTALARRVNAPFARSHARRTYPRHYHCKPAMQLLCRQRRLSVTLVNQPARVQAPHSWSFLCRRANTGQRGPYSHDAGL